MGRRRRCSPARPPTMRLPAQSSPETDTDSPPPGRWERCRCFFSADTCSGRLRRASSAPWMAGCSVLTRPSSSSGKPVTFSTSSTGTLAARSAAAVPPVEMISQPSWTRRLGKGDHAALVADGDQGARHESRSSRSRVDGYSSRIVTTLPGCAATRTAAKHRPPAPLPQASWCSASSTRAASRSGVSSGQHGNSRLRQHCSPIVDLVDQMNRDAGFLVPAGQHGLMHPAVRTCPCRRTPGSRAGWVLMMRPRYDATTGAGTSFRYPASTTQIDPVRPERPEPLRPASSGSGSTSDWNVPASGVGQARRPRRDRSATSTTSRAHQDPAREGAPRGCCRGRRWPRLSASSWRGKVMGGAGAIGRS